MRAEAPTRPWLFSPAVDLLVGCGAWTLPFLALAFYFQREYAAGAALTFYLLALFCNQPHYMATIYRAYHTAADFNQYRFFTVYVTVLALLAAVLAHVVPGLFPWLVTLYLSWSPWHYTAQNFGIAQMMTRRGGLAAASPGREPAPPDPAARRLLHASYVASFAVWLVTLHTAHDTADPYFHSLRLPEGLATPLQIVGTLAFLGCAGAAFGRLALALPFRALIPALTLTVTQLLWFVAPALLVRFGSLALPASYFSAGALAFMHCAQYLWITSYFAAREAGRAGRRYSFARHYLVLIVGGIALFLPGPWLASRVLGHDFVESFLIFTALVNLHHFILDGAIWKLRDGRISRLLLGRNPPEQEKFQTPKVQMPNMTSHLGWLFGASLQARATRWTLGAALLALAALDQWQYYSTSHLAGPAALTRAATVNPNDPRPAFRLAQLLNADGNFGAARDELEGILRLNPGNSPAQHLLGETLLRSGDTATALAHYDRIYGLYPDDLGVALNRGLAAAGQGQAPKAVASYTRAVGLAPDNIAAHAGLAAALAQAHEAARAVEEYEVVFPLCEASGDLADYLDASLRQSDLLLVTSDPAAWERAEKRLQRAADIAATQHIFPVAAEALGRLAAVQDKMGRPGDAAKNRALAAQAALFAK